MSEDGIEGSYSCRIDEGVVVVDGSFVAEEVLVVVVVVVVDEARAVVVVVAVVVLLFFEGKIPLPLLMSKETMRDESRRSFSKASEVASMTETMPRCSFM